MERTGFTLVELLVVIAIIALLLSVLMPSLRQAREQAYGVVCDSRLKEFGVMYQMYTDDNNYSLPAGWNSGEMWMTDLLSYYEGAENIRLCPKATKFLHEVPNNGPGTLTAWGKYGHPDFLGGNIPVWAEEDMYGSYGVNGWAHNPPAQGVSGTYDIPDSQQPLYWRKITKITVPLYNVPLMGGCMWDGTTPLPNDSPSTKKPPDWGMSGGLNGNEYTGLSDMAKFCLPRHNGKVGMLFMDQTVRRIKLKELWSLHWHTQWEEKRIRWSKYPWINEYPE